MSLATRRTSRAHDALRESLDRLQQVAALGSVPGRLPEDVTRDLSDTAARARGRLGQGAAQTVVALAGATGSGKSSLFNAIAGRDVADVGVRRPTTSTAQAAVFDESGELDPDAGALLDWLGIGRRHVVDGERGRQLGGLVLLDLPDHDSTAVEHRREVDRLVEVVDAFVWVVDPQKYADLALHEQYIRRFATHTAVTIVVLNQIDQVAETARRPLVADLDRVLRDDGLRDVRVITTSTRSGEGVPELIRELAARASERRAVVARLLADVDAWAQRLAAEVGDGDPRPVDAASQRRLARAFASAAGADAVADAVGAAHRHRAIKEVGWPPTRWLRRFRADPLRRLGLDRPRPVDGTTVSRTSRPGPSAVAEAAATTAVRSLVDETSTGLPPPWQRRIADVAAARRADVGDALDRAVASAVLPTSAPRWWNAVAAAQKLLAGVMVIGLLWLLVLGVAGWFRLPDIPTPRLGDVPWPTGLAIGGAVLGILLGVVGRAAAGVGARRRTARARRVLEDATAVTAQQLVVEPVNGEVEALAQLRRLVHDLRRRGP